MVSLDRGYLELCLPIFSGNRLQHVYKSSFGSVCWVSYEGPINASWKSDSRPLWLNNSIITTQNNSSFFSFPFYYIHISLTSEMSNQVTTLRCWSHSVQGACSSGISLQNPTVFITREEVWSEHGGHWVFLSRTANFNSFGTHSGAEQDWEGQIAGVSRNTCSMVWIVSISLSLPWDS